MSHARFGAVRHRFRYRLSMLGLDLDQLQSAFHRRWFWSIDRPNLASFRRADHLRGETDDLATAARDVVEKQTGNRPLGAIELLTQPRYFGMCFNPVSLYLCHDQGGLLRAVIAEVHNTPWGAQHAYVLDVSHDDRMRDVWHAEFDKTFHVSPFMPMDIRYRLRLRRSGQLTVVSIDSWRRGRVTFSARLWLRSKPLSAKGMAQLLVTTPLMTVKIVTAIYWEALRLWLKRAPFFAHPAAQ